MRKKYFMVKMEYYTNLTNDVAVISTLDKNMPHYDHIMKMFIYPKDIIELMIEKADLMINILRYYKNILDDGIKNNITFLSIRVEIMNKKLENESMNKQLYNKFHTILYEHLNNREWFREYYENIEGSINILKVDFEIKDMDIDTSNFIWRENQAEAIEIRNREGLQTGIHCQATGTGKSALIINDIDYIRNVVNRKCKIILFTERVNILKDLFAFHKDHDNNPRLEEWKYKGIGDLTDFNIIDRVTQKTYDWTDLLNDSDKPTIVVINRAFLTSARSRHQDIINLDAIIIDECHASVSNKCHDFLTHWKERNVPIIGYSATPLRAGKTDGKFNKEKLLEIFSMSNDPTKLNLITNYNMIYSIEKGLILPPKFAWFDIEDRESETKFEITEKDYKAVLNVLNDVMKWVESEKIIAWCGTINNCEQWRELFEKYKNMFTDLDSKHIFIDHSKKPDDYETFKNIIGNAILVCAQKHREGSDISKLDVAIFLDRVKDRSAVVFIQSIGRVLRIDPENPLKTFGVIVEGVHRSNKNYDKDFIDKILGYYFALENISDIDGEDCYEKYAKIMDVVKFDTKHKIINMSFGDIEIPINCASLCWKDVIKNFQKILSHKVKMSPLQMFNIYVETLKKQRTFKNPNNDFWAEYEKLDHDELNLPKDIYEEYEEIFAEKTWYDILGYKDLFHTIDQMQEIVYNEYPDIKTLTKKEYNILKSKHGLVPYPFEYYRLEKISKYNQLL